MPTFHVPLEEHSIGFVTVTVPTRATPHDIRKAAHAAYDDGAAFITRSHATFDVNRIERA